MLHVLNPINETSFLDQKGDKDEIYHPPNTQHLQDFGGFGIPNTRVLKLKLLGDGDRSVFSWEGDKKVFDLHMSVWMRITKGQLDHVCICAIHGGLGLVVAVSRSLVNQPL